MSTPPPEPILPQTAPDTSAEKYRTLFDSIDAGFTIIEVLFDESEKPSDYRFLEINPAFERQTGIENATGRRMREFAPQLEEFWFETYGRIALTGEPSRFEHQAEALGRWYDVYAVRIGEPERRQVAVLFTDIMDRKRLEEERLRIIERERNIALQLQEALTPTIPSRVSGMGLAKYYKSALAESEVGGDFYDVFSVTGDCTALVVGDLSGKGLAAASQVATVRNMLRYAVYQAPSLAQAVQSLNGVLVEQSLLTGFATLFVGCYDAVNGVLNYVNAGQEPALVLRASGQVDLLSPTGPVLGAFEGAVFAEEPVTLGPGDALAIFTDGMTEVGVSRKEMLEIEGVADLFSHSLLREDAVAEKSESTEEEATRLVERLIDGVGAYGQYGIRDDVCLLVGVIETPTSSRPT